MNPDEPGRTGTDGHWNFTGRVPNGDVMRQVPWRLVAVAVVLAAVVGLTVAVAGLTVAVAGGDGQPTVTAEMPTAPATGADIDSEPQLGTNGTELGAGEQLAGMVATQDGTVSGSVDRDSFQAQLDATESPAERAGLIDSWLSDIDGQLTELETKLDELDANDESESDSGTGPTARTAAVGAEATALQALLGDIEDAMHDLPAAEREQRDLLDRHTAHDERVTTLRERTQEARQLVDGTDSETWAAPVTPADVEEAADRSMAAVGGADRFFGSERIDLHVRRANGSTLRLAVETDGGEVNDIERGSHDDPTVRVYTDYGVVRTLQRTDDVGGALEEAREGDRIVYEGAGLYNSIRYGAVAILERVVP